MNELSSHKYHLDTVYVYFSRFIDLSRAEFDQIVPYFEIRKFEAEISCVHIVGTSSGICCRNIKLIFYSFFTTFFNPKCHKLFSKDFISYI